MDGGKTVNVQILVYVIIITSILVLTSFWLTIMRLIMASMQKSKFVKFKCCLQCEVMHLQFLNIYSLGDYFSVFWYQVLK